MKNISFVNFSILILLLLQGCSKESEKEVEILKYNLSVSVTPEDGGSISEISDSYDKGTSVQLTGIPSSDYIFKEWTGDVTGTSNPISMTMNSNKMVTGVFEKRKYPLSIIIEGEGTVSEELLQSKSKKDYPSGSLVQLTGVPNDGWKFVEWSGDIESLENPIQVNVNEDKSIIVKFEKGSEMVYRESIIQLRNEVLGIIRPDGDPSWFYSFDLESDGDMDMILIHSGPYGSPKKEMILFKNFNNQSFERIDTGINCWGRTVVFEDFNNDGLIDFFVPDFGFDLPPFPGGQNQMIYQSSDGRLEEVTNQVLPQLSNVSHGGTTLDLENDGDKDLVVNNGGNQIVYRNINGLFEVWENGFNPRLEESYHDVVGHPTIDGVLRMDIWETFISGWWSNSGDFNNDGLDDVIIGGGFVDFSDPPDENNVKFRTVDPYDNILEKGDLILLQDKTTGQLKYNYPNSVIENSWGNSSLGGVTIGVLVNDYNIDGCLDFITYSSNYNNSHRVELKMGDCNGFFETSNIFELPISETNDTLWGNFELVDIDGDGDIDVIISNTIEWVSSHLIPEEHVVLENVNGVFTFRLGESKDLIYLPPNIGISWYLDGE